MRLPSNSSTVNTRFQIAGRGRHKICRRTFHILVVECTKQTYSWRILLVADDVR